MDATRFDAIARRFAARRSRRRALAEAGAGLAAAALGVGLARPSRGQDAEDALATPAATPPAGGGTEAPAMLFLQAFQAGRVAPKEGAEGRYVLTLEQGLGQTVYFSDRPDRIVGATPTPAFLEGLGFADDNPPNAALVVEGADGATEIAVVELFNPDYDEATHTATYEAAVLAEWENELGVGFHEAPADLAALGSSFGAAHLFIDDCADATVECINWRNDVAGSFSNVPMCWNYSMCMPCEPFGHTQPDTCSTFRHWGMKCNAEFPTQGDQGCGEVCRPRTMFDFWGLGC